MKFAATVMHREHKHTLRDWRKHFVKDAEAKFVSNEDSQNSFYTSSVLWAQIKIITNDWVIGYSNCQIIQTLDINNFYTFSYLILDDDGNRLIVTSSGHTGFGSVFDINICFVGDEATLNKHLKLANITPDELNVIQKH